MNKYENDDELDIDGKPTIIFDWLMWMWCNQDWIVYFYQLKIWNKQNE
jgi:hypothetical protein